jgi:hypothetical protein
MSDQLQRERNARILLRKMKEIQELEVLVKVLKAQNAIILQENPFIGNILGVLSKEPEKKKKDKRSKSSKEKR